MLEHTLKLGCPTWKVPLPTRGFRCDRVPHPGAIITKLWGGHDAFPLQTRGSGPATFRMYIGRFPPFINNNNNDNGGIFHRQFLRLNQLSRDS
jgi:hypothetical protein